MKNRKRHQPTTGRNLYENLDLGVLQIIPAVRALGKRATVPLIWNLPCFGLPHTEIWCCYYHVYWPQERGTHASAVVSGKLGPLLSHSLLSIPFCLFSVMHQFVHCVGLCCRILFTIFRLQRDNFHSAWSWFALTKILLLLCLSLKVIISTQIDNG